MHNKLLYNAYRRDRHARGSSMFKYRREKGGIRSTNLRIGSVGWFVPSSAPSLSVLILSSFPRSSTYGDKAQHIYGSASRPGHYRTAVYPPTRTSRLEYSFGGAEMQRQFQITLPFFSRRGSQDDGPGQVNETGDDRSETTPTMAAMSPSQKLKLNQAERPQ